MMEDKIAVVTGGNRGIGLEVCRQLAQAGITVVLTARHEAKAKAAAEGLKKDGLQVHYQLLDVTDSGSVHQFMTTITETFGRLDILVNNAGILIDRDESGFEVSLKTVQQTLDCNLYGPLRMCQAVFPLMQQQNYGRIVNVSSRLGQLSAIGGKTLAYRVSKTALNSLTAVLAHEVVDNNILINTMSPGWVRTDMGGPEANRSVAEGADTIVWLALLPDDGPNGQFFIDRQAVPW